MKPDAASLPPVLILASGFILLLAIAAIAANPGVFLPEEPPADPDPEPDACAGTGPTPTGPASPSGGPAAPTMRAGCDGSAGALT